MSIIISFCIPTYNRSKELAEAINSILIQLNGEIEDKIEICISDNCSTDDTYELIEKIKLNTKIKFNYFRNDKNYGPDYNFINVIKLATGKYCWFLGSDDLIKFGSIKRILKEINENNYSIYITNRDERTVNLKKIQNSRWLDTNADASFHFKDNNELHKYFGISTSLGALFSFLSSIIFRRDDWNSIIFDESFLGTAYSHAMMLLSIILEGGSLKYINDPLVISRQSNFDTFARMGFVKRFLIDIEGYLALADKYFKNKNELRQKFLKIIKKEHRYSKLIMVKYRCISIEEWEYVKEKLLYLSYNVKFIDVISSIPRYLLFPFYSFLIILKKITYYSKIVFSFYYTLQDNYEIFSIKHKKLHIFNFS